MSDHQTTMTTCPDCAGTGGGHPDDTGYRCHRCGGTGGVPEITPLPPMTVGQLVALLAAMPQDAPILIPGYESGSTSVEGASLARVVRDNAEAWYFGEWRPPHDDEPSTEAVYLNGVRHG